MLTARFHPVHWCDPYRAFQCGTTNAFRTIAECGLRFHGVSDVAAISMRIPSAVRACWVSQTAVAHAERPVRGLLADNNGPRFPWLNHNRPCVAVDINRLMRHGVRASISTPTSVGMLNERQGSPYVMWCRHFSVTDL